YDSGNDLVPAVFDRQRGLLIIGNSAGEVQSIDTHEKREIASAKQIDKIESLALHPNGTLLAIGDRSGQIRLRNLSPAGGFAEDQNQPWHAHQGTVYSLAWSLDGSRLISAGNDGQITSWNLRIAESAVPQEFQVETAGEFRLQAETTSLVVK